MKIRRCTVASLVAVVLLGTTSACGWQGLNSLPLPGAGGAGPGAYLVQAQLPDLDNLHQNSRVRVGDVTVGSVVKVERQGWHALITMRIDGTVTLPANATAKLGQTSLLGSQHVELAPPTDEPPHGRLHGGSRIPLSRGSAYPTTEHTLATMSLLFNGGGLGQVQDITEAFSTAGADREDQLRSLLQQLDTFAGDVADQTSDIIAAVDSLDRLTGQFADNEPVLDRALQTIPRALAVLTDHRYDLAEALDQLGKLSAIAADSVDRTKQAIVTELRNFAAILKSLADAGPALTRALGAFVTFPWQKDTVDKFVRGDYANFTLILDLTLSRLDNALFTGTRWEGDLTELELQWGRTIGQLPSPYTGANPLLAPYHFDQGP